MQKKKITVKELAQKLGVSVSTVSKALNDSYEISDKTKKRVQKLARKYNYKPNRLAVNLKAGNTRTVGVILPALSNFFTTVLSGIEKVTNEENYSLITCISNESHAKEVTNTEVLSRGSIDGLIIALAEETQVKRDFSHLEECIGNGNPVVMFDRVTRAVDCDKVVVDDYNDAYLATRHLIEKGCKRPALVSSIDFLSVGKLRVKGFVSAVEEFIGESSDALLIRGSEEELEEKILRLLKDNQVDGFFGVDEDSSLAIKRVLKRVGLKVPQEIRVIGYSGEKIAENLSPSLTTVNQNGALIGESAARILIGKLQEQNGDFVTRIIPTQIEQRGST